MQRDAHVAAHRSCLLRPCHSTFTPQLKENKSVCSCGPILKNLKQVWRDSPGRWAAIRFHKCAVLCILLFLTRVSVYSTERQSTNKQTNRKRLSLRSGPPAAPWRDGAARCKYWAAGSSLSSSRPGLGRSERPPLFPLAVASPQPGPKVCMYLEKRRAGEDKGGEWRGVHGPACNTLGVYRDGTTSLSHAKRRFTDACVWLLLPGFLEQYRWHFGAQGLWRGLSRQD